MSREEVQPYFRAFMIERGYLDSSEASNLDYLIWNGDRWREFDKLTDRKTVGFRSVQERQAFGAWLEDRSSTPSRPRLDGGEE